MKPFVYLLPCNAAGNPEDADELLDLIGVLTSAFDACCKKLDNQ